MTYRSLFLSDLHLGTRDCKTEFLHDFPDRVETEQRSNAS